MAKAKKQINKEMKTKALAHRRLAKEITSNLSEAFWINKTLGKSLIANISDLDGFDFVITIAINPTITIKSINVNGAEATEGDFAIKDNNIVCRIEALVSVFTFPLLIEAEGDDPDAITTFNMTCDGKKVFEEDQKITIAPTGKGGYNNQDIPLP